MSIKILNNDQLPASAILQGDLERVLVMQSDNAGDIVMLSPALRALRKSLPGAEITLMTSPEGSQVVPLLPWVDHVMVDDDLWQDSPDTRLFNPRREAAFVERLRRHSFSLALIFTRFSQSSLPAAHACYLAGIPKRVGFAGEAGGMILSHVMLPPANEMHQVDRNLSLLAAIDIPSTDRQTDLSIPAEAEISASRLLCAAGLEPNIPYIVIAPGSAGEVSQYSPQHFAAVAHILAAQIEERLLIVGNASEVSTMQPMLELVHENLYGNVFSLVEKTNLPELAAIIRRASLTIANNSVSMHIADAFACPMVILHSEMEIASQWMPRNASARLMSRPVSCSPYSHAESSYGINCLDVRPEEVAIAALELLSEQNYEQPSYRVLNYQ
jgi:ADP-heptose:LPS heptosyltransferase